MDTQPSVTLPSKIVVSLRVGAVLALANIVCVVIFASAWTRIHTVPKSINVTGSAKKEISSDLVVWRADVSVIRPALVDAYAKLAPDMAKTVDYLKAQGVDPKDIAVSAITTVKHYVKDKMNGQNTDQISEYELTQHVEVTSSNVKLITDVSRSVTTLIQDGVLLDSQAPEYLYTRMADLKIAMLAAATQDATNRAHQIADNSGGKLGSVLEAHMGVMQINALHRDDVSGSGVNDTTSPDKEIMAVVSASFALQ